MSDPVNHQAFLSYRHCDSDIANQAKVVLEANGVRCWRDVSDLRVSSSWDEEIARAIAESRLLVLLISPGSIESPKEQKREVSIAEKYSVPVVPVFVASPNSCRAFDYLLATTQHIDASKPPLLEQLEAAAEKVRQLLNTLALTEMKGKASARAQPSPAPASTAPVSPSADRPPSSTRPAAPSSPASSASRVQPLNVAMLYKRGVAEDERLLDLVQQRLTSRGHNVFVDRQVGVGVEWRRFIREKVENADAVIPLLSLFSIGSEMLEEEVRIASRHQQLERGRPRILPVRVNYEGALPPDLAQPLQRLQYVLWRSSEDDERVLSSLVESLERPATDPATVAEQREMPVGAVPLTSPFYIVRDGDRIFQSGIERQDSIVLVKGARQMGKTSLIARGLQLAREKKQRAAITDLQTFNESDFKDLRSLYSALGGHLADQLDIDACLDDRWDDRKAANVNFERFIRRDILAAAETPLVWALDEVDRLFASPFGTEVFGLFRSWHNARALDPSGPWSRLTLVIGYATEASLFIRDVNMSPFNVGTQLTLSDFTAEEVGELNARYGSPLHGENDIRRLMDVVGGQPFLVRRSLYALAVEGMPLDKLLADAATDHGIFGDHLRRFCISLHRDPELEAATRDFIIKGRELPAEQFLRLRSAGLVVGEVRHEATVRCGIYRDYLRTRLA